MVELNQTLSFFQQKFVNKDKFSCSDDDASASTSSFPPRHLSPSRHLSPCHLSSPHNDHNKDDDIVDSDVDKIIGGDNGIDRNKYDKFRNYEIYDSEEERNLNSLMKKYDIVS